MAAGNPNISNYGHETRWKPGVSANPKGRPQKGNSFKDVLEEYAYLPTKVVMPDGSIAEKPVIDSIALSLLGKARKGDIAAAKEILDRFYGKQAEKMELTGRDGKALEINHGVSLDSAYNNIMDAFGVEVLEVIEQKE